ncbi:hypothetical protein NYO67_11238 [Aspergillus flavus]|nr:hypothetical protein NYO67_11238 [Aspergillus flavus]
MTPLTKPLVPDDGVAAPTPTGRFLLRSFAWGPRDFSGMENPEIIVALTANEK